MGARSALCTPSLSLARENTFQRIQGGQAAAAGRQGYDSAGAMSEGGVAASTKKRKVRAKETKKRGLAKNKDPIGFEWVGGQLEAVRRRVSRVLLVLMSRMLWCCCFPLRPSVDCYFISLLARTNNTGQHYKRQKLRRCQPQSGRGRRRRDDNFGGSWAPSALMFPDEPMSGGYVAAPMSGGPHCRPPGLGIDGISPSIDLPLRRPARGERSTAAACSAVIVGG